MVEARKQEEVPEEEEAPEEATAPAEGRIEEKLNALFKALSELQAAVKDLASAMGASAEATRGLKEALLGDFKASLLEDLKKVVTVGMPAAAAEHKTEDKRPEPTPTKKPEAVGEPVSAPPANIQEPSAIYEKKSEPVEVVKTERPPVEVKKSHIESPTSELIRGVLTGEIKGMNIVKKLREVVSHE